jgi:hypothetical protein
VRCSEISSHNEAPGNVNDAAADNTDVRSDKTFALISTGEGVSLLLLVDLSSISVTAMDYFSSKRR